MSKVRKKENSNPKVQSTPGANLFSEAIGFQSNRFFDLYFYVALIVAALVIYQDFLFGNKVFLFKDIGSDTVNGVYPMIVQNSKIWADEMNGWSFHSGMGQNVMGYFLREPFEFLLYGKDPEGIAKGMAMLEFIKVVLAGLFFYLFLCRVVQNKIAAAVGSFLFTFSGYIILGGCWCLFSFEAMNLALLLWAVEMALQKKHFWIFSIGLFLIGISQPFNLYVYGSFILTYSVMRFLILEMKWKDLWAVLLPLSVFGILGIAASAYFLTPQIHQILESPRGSGNSSYTDVLKSAPMFSTPEGALGATTLLRFFSSDYLGTGNDFKGWTNYLEAPLLYVGLFSLLLFPQIFTGEDKRRKIIYASFFALWFLPLLFPWFRYAFWLFSGDYFRAYSFFAAFPLTFFTVISFDAILNGKKFNSVLHLAWSLFLLLVSSLAFKSVTVDSSMATYVKLFLIVQAVLIYLIANKKLLSIGLYALLAFIAIEAIVFSFITVNNRNHVKENELAQKIGYNDFTNDAISYLKQNDQSFYRIDKAYYSGPAMHGSLNDAVIQNYFGTCCYNSFNNINYVTFMQSMGIIKVGNEVESRWIPGLMGRPILENLCSVKYLLFKGVLNQGLKFSYDSLTTFNDVKLVKSRYSLPLGFTYDTIIDKSTFAKLKPPVSDVVLMKSCMIDSADRNKLSEMPEFDLKDTTSAYGWDQLIADVKQRKSDTLQITFFSQKHINGKINLAKSKLLFISIPFDKGWTAFDNGTQIEVLKTMNGLSGLYLTKGSHTIEMRYEQRLRDESKMLSYSSILLLLIASLWSPIKKRLKTGQP